jgi:hypothetical protein
MAWSSILVYRSGLKNEFVVLKRKWKALYERNQTKRNILVSLTCLMWRYNHLAAPSRDQTKRNVIYQSFC